MIRWLRWSSLILLSVLLTACGTPEEKGRQIQPFSFTDQYGNDFGLEQLKGEIWVADFIFTNCTTVCPPMTAEMSKLQTRAKEEGLDIHFVSFTVDPTIDTPETMHQYVNLFTDDDSNWHALTGYTQKEIEELALHDFRTIVQKPDHSDQVIHSTNFYLVSRNGKVIDEFYFFDETYMDRLFEAVRTFY